MKKRVLLSKVRLSRYFPFTFTFSSYFFTGTILIALLLLPGFCLSYFPGWVNSQPFFYQNPLYSSMYPFSGYPMGLSSPWSFASAPFVDPALSYFSFGQSPLLFGWSNSAMPWNSSLFNNPFQIPGLASSFLAGYLPENNLLFSGQLFGGNPLGGISMLSGLSPFGSITRLPKARTAAAVIPPPQVPSLPGIDVPLFQYKPLESLPPIFPPPPGYVAGQAVVTFRPGTLLADMIRVYAAHQVSELYASPFAGFRILSVPPSLTVPEVILGLSLEPCVLHASPNYYRRAHLVPNDPYYQYQWHLPKLNCGWAWDLSVGAGAVVGLLDSGVAYQTLGLYAKAPDLAGTLFLPGYDFINLDTSPDDDYGHGTHMAGCIAQTTNNLLGVAGVAFSATIMPVKVMDNLGSTPITAEVDGIYFAANSGVNIINMSLGGPGTDATEQAAVTYAYNNGVTLICSSGNGVGGVGTSVPEYPASYTECISVSATRYDNTITSYSNYGLYIDVCSPGGDLNVDQNLDGFGDGILQQTHDGTNYTTFYYYFMQGTSPAAALVSGVAALIVSKSTVPLSPLNITGILEGTATDLGTVGWDQYYGYGLVNAYLAVLQTP